MFLDTLGEKDQRSARAARRLEALYKAWGKPASGR
jgi:hypothetical protein